MNLCLLVLYKRKVNEEKKGLIEIEGSDIESDSVTKSYVIICVIINILCNILLVRFFSNYLIFIILFLIIFIC